MAGGGSALGVTAARGGRGGGAGAGRGVGGGRHGEDRMNVGVGGGRMGASISGINNGKPARGGRGRGRGGEGEGSQPRQFFAPLPPNNTIGAHAGHMQHHMQHHMQAGHMQAGVRGLAAAQAIPNVLLMCC